MQGSRRDVVGSMRKVEQLGFECTHREETAGLIHPLGDLTVQYDLLAGDLQFTLQSLHEAAQVPDLQVGELPCVPVANQADADGSFIVGTSGVAHHMGTGQLASPAIAHMDFAIREAIAVSDKEVISKPA